MQRIYLDQNKWIDLARTAQNKKGVRHFGDALRMVREGVRLRQASFVLSNVHYRETSSNPNARQRSELADLMLELSQMHTIAPMNLLVQAELDCGLKRIFGRPEQPRNVQVFGVGVRHAVGDPGIEIGLDTSVPLPPAVRWRLQALADKQLEWVALAGMPDDLEVDAKEECGIDPRARAINYAAAQQCDKIDLQDARWHKGERGKRRAYANTLAGFLDPLNEALEYGRVSADEFGALSQSEMTAFIRSVPIMYVDSQLERVQNASCRDWSANDLNDLDALMRALVYCDIVVAEKYWINAARQARLDEEFGTVLLTSLDDLPTAMMK